MTNLLNEKSYSQLLASSVLPSFLFHTDELEDESSGTCQEHEEEEKVDNN